MGIGLARQLFFLGQYLGGNGFRRFSTKNTGRSWAVAGEMHHDRRVDKVEHGAFSGTGSKHMRGYQRRLRG